MLTVILQDYNEPSESRRAEYDACIAANLNNHAVGTVLNCCEQGYRNPKFEHHPKMKFQPLDKRMTFRDAVEVSNTTLDNDTLVVLVNLDIHLTSAWEHAKALVPPGSSIALCLGRHEVDEHGQLHANHQLAAVAHANAQDAWAWRTPLHVRDADFHIGAVGCEHAFANRLNQAGRQPVNPMYTLPVAQIDSLTRDFPYRRRNTNNKKEYYGGSYLVPAMDADGTYKNAIIALFNRMDSRLQQSIVHELYNKLITIKN